MAELLKNPFSKNQLYMLELMANTSEEELKDIKKIIVKYFAQKLTIEADNAWNSNNWSASDEKILLESHLRTPYTKK